MSRAKAMGIMFQKIRMLWRLFYKGKEFFARKASKAKTPESF
jgi:hypothetical protein